MAKTAHITEEAFPGEYGPWEAATGPVNVLHTADQHPYEGDPNEWSTDERIGSRATCTICRVIFNAGGGWRAEGPARRTPELAERENRTTHRGPARTVYPASEAQCNFLDSLWRDRDHSDLIEDVLVAAKADKRAASNLITLLKDRPYAKKAESKSTGGRVTEDGMYRRAADGVVFKVQVAVHGSGNLYAKELVIDADTKTGRFEYAAGAIKTLTPADKMTLDQAKEFGRLYGVCCRCGATLTDENSIEAGIGPVCAGKF